MVLADPRTAVHKLSGGDSTALRQAQTRSNRSPEEHAGISQVSEIAATGSVREQRAGRFNAAARSTAAFHVKRSAGPADVPGRGASRTRPGPRRRTPAPRQPRARAADPP